LVGKFTGNQLPPPLTAVNYEFYLCFSSDESGTAGGFSANWNVIVPMYCASQTTLLEPDGEVCDGSGTNYYYNNTNCSWLIAPAEATEITLRFTQFATEMNYDYVRIYHGSQPIPGNMLYQYSGTLLTPFQVTIPHGQVLVVFTSDGSVTNEGWCFTYTSDGVPPPPTCVGVQTLTAPAGAFCDGSGSQNYTNNLECGWKIVPQGNVVSIKLWFDEFALASGDKVTVYASDEPNVIPLASYSAENLPPDTIYIGHSAAYVQFFTNHVYHAAGWCAQYSAALIAPGCIGAAEPLTAPSGTFSDGSGDSDYNHNLFCTWTIRPTAPHTNIVLRFNTFATEAGKDFVRVYDGPNQQSTLLGSFSGTPSVPFEIVGTAQEMLVVFTSDASGAAGGWDAEYEILNDPARCSGTQTLTTPSGTFSDGSGAEKYGVNSECYWLIQPPGIPSIELSFDEFELEANADFVRIYDGVSTQSPLLASLTGNEIPPMRTYSTPILVGFRTNGKNNFAGFTARYQPTTSRPNPVGSILHVYPNPNDGTFVVRATRPGRIVVTDAKGAAVKTFAIEGEAQVALERSGIYALTYSSGTTTQTVRVAVVK
ncbi:MAG: CUB domain-containing protein, partial [Bacteroidia bacterium]|nr:T9SS type A sorting domain-containing protein [Bacteroidia bacterium]MDW8334535.1 CUB domain-containing protein [Bacteroidia bacterium]